MKSRHNLIATSHLLLVDEHKVLLSLRQNTGYEDGHYSLIGGHVEAGETVRQCIIREAREEVGIVVKLSELSFCQVIHRSKESADDGDRLDFFFKCLSYEGRIQNLESNKCKELNWFDLENLPSNLIPFMKSFFEKLDADKYQEFGW